MGGEDCIRVELANVLEGNSVEVLNSNNRTTTEVMNNILITERKTVAELRE